MLFLGIDPGSRHTGFGLVETVGDRLRIVAEGRISPNPKQPLAERLAELSRGLSELIDRHPPDAAALETPFHGLNSRSLIVLAQARGSLLAMLAGRGLTIREYSPAEVKMAIAGHGRADKLQVARMVRLLLRLENRRLTPDASDALAVAICCAHRHHIDRLKEDPR